MIVELFDLTEKSIKETDGLWGNIVAEYNEVYGYPINVTQTFVFGQPMYHVVELELISN